MADLLARLASLPPSQQRRLLARIAEEGGAANAFPLSFSQERLWFLDQLAPASALYNLPAALRLAGPLDLAALARSRNETVRRHESLRTAFPALSGQPIQVVLPYRPEALPVVDLSDLPAARREAVARSLAAEQLFLPFDLARGPLLRLLVLRLDAADHALVLALHHIVSDAWSMAVLLGEIAALYTAFSAGKPSPLPEPQFQLRDFVLRQRRALVPERLAAEIVHWRGRLAGAPFELELPADRPRPAVQSFRGTACSFAFDRATAEALRAFAATRSATLYMLLLAAYAALLARFTASDDLLLGTAIAQRDRPELEGLIGLLINTLVLRADLTGDPPFITALDRAREVVLDAHAHQDLPFEKLVEALQPERSLSRSPLFQVAFDLQTLPAALPAMPGIAVQLLDGESVGRTAKFDLRLSMMASGESLAGTFEYATDLFDPPTIARLAEHLLGLLRSALAGAQRRLSDLDLLTAGERHQLLREWNDTADPGGWEGGAGARFAAQAARTPGALALAYEGERLTYRQLSGRAGLLAGHLRRLGVGEQSLVGICLERSPDMITAILGVLAAGAAYLPLDPANPPDRLAYMVTDAAVPFVITRPELAARLPASNALPVLLDAGWEERLAAAAGAGPATTVEAVPAGPDDLAYVIYTSGSTGRPKGARLTHRGLCNLVDGFIPPGARVLQFSFFNFDASVVEIFMALFHGAALFLARPESLLPGPALVELLRKEAIDTLLLPPAALAVVPEALLPDLRTLIVAGEACSAELVARWGRGRRFWNAYGPTEASVCATFTACAPEEGRPGIGRPIRNVQTYILDRRWAVVPVGVPGELAIGGESVGRGYLGRPAETAERFVPDPFGGLTGARLYRTGDLVRHRPDGGLDFLGRIDHQVKIRGYRIELGEIEEVLKRHEAVLDAAVAAVPAILAPGGPGGERRLVAYVVARDGAGGPGSPGPLGDSELRSWLEERLPKYMVPALFLLLAALPRNRSGKLDRAALPAPEARRARVASRLPRTAVQRTVAGIWSEVLGLAEVGIDDNFFDLGGHSLHLARVHGRLSEAIPAAAGLSLVDLLTYTTVGALAEHLDRQFAGEPAPIVPLALAAMAPAGRPAGGSGVAVIGLALRLPGAATPEAFWENLAAGVESITFFSPEELLAAGAPAELVGDPRYVPARGCLDGIDLLDAELFRLQPRQAALMDPQQRIFLECVWEALERAGYKPGPAGGRIGLFAGAGLNSYSFRFHADPGLIGDVDLLQAILNNEKDHLATRISYLLDLEGPSVAVQSSCSTSLVAVHLACQSLLAGDCEIALAGGVSIDARQRSGYLYQEGGILSPDGHCRAFDASARGTVSSSGAAVVVLKRLADAERDGDTIWAVVRGSAINNDGARKVGYTAPRIEGQARVIREAQARSGVRSEEISYVEAHGTGTELGDPIEVAALCQAFGPGGAAGSCALGSLKTNLGHLDAAAGVAGLIKTVLALRHRALPPSLHFVRPNPSFDFAGSPFYVNDRLRPWEAAAPRRAGVSSFGIGGTNAHVIVEEAPEATDDSDGVPARPCQLLLLSARSESALEAATDNLARHLESHPELDLADVAYTLQVGRRTFPWRRVAVCRDRGEAAALLARRDPRRVMTGCQDRQDLPVTFLFPGQGAQHVGMGRELYDAEPLFRREIDRCAEILLPSLGTDLRWVLYPVAGEEAAAAERLNTMTFCQPALFAVEHSLGRLWMAWLGEPQAMIGHSVGEYAAACLAGVLSLEDALTLVAARGRLMDETGEGVMLAVPLAEADLLPRLGPELAIAAINGPERCVVSGPGAAAAALEERLGREGISCRLLHVPGAFHGPAVDPILDRLAAEVRSVTLRPPRIRYVSTLSGTWIQDEEATDPDYWVRHLRRTVRFSPGLVELWREADGPMLEVGPGRTLTSLVNQHPGRPAEREVLSSLRHPREQASDLEIVTATLGRLWLHGGRVSWAAVHDGERRRRVPLATYPFERQRYWIEERRIEKRRPARLASLPEDGSHLMDVIGSGGAWLLAGPATEASRGFARHLAAAGARLTLALEPARCGIELAEEGERLLALEAELEGERQVESMSDLPGLEAGLDRLCSRLALDFLERGGIATAPGRVWRREDLVRTLRVLPGFGRFLDTLLAMLEQDGLVAPRSSGDLEVLPAAAGLPAAAALADEMGRRYPSYAGLVRLLAGCAERYGAALSGDIPAIEVLYPGGRRSPLLDGDDSPRERQELPIELLCRLLAQLPAGPAQRELRILEVGAGTGLLTRAVVAALAGRRFTYTFTDLGPTFVRAAEAEAARQGLSGMSFRLFDIARDPLAQGFAAGTYDVVVGLNVVHATPSLAASVEHLARLLAPGGLLALVEPVRPARHLDMIWGLAEGWWSFADPEIRPRSPLAVLPVWERVLSAAGLQGVAGFPSAAAQRSRRDFALVLGQTPQAPVASSLAVAVEEAERRLGAALQGLLLTEPGPADARALGALLDRPGLELAVVSMVSGPAESETDALLHALAAQRAAAVDGAALRIVRFTGGEPADGGELLLQAAAGSFVEVRVAAPAARAAQAAREARALEARLAAQPAATVASTSARPAREEVPGNAIAARLAEIWVGVLGTRIGLHDNFFERGADSLAILGLTARIRDTWQVDVPLRRVLEAPTVAELAARVGEALIRRDAAQTLVRIQAGSGERVPFFTVHAAGGNVLCYYNLARHLGVERPVYALQAPGLEGEREEIFSRLGELAAHHVAAVRSARPHGPYLLGGWSAGGTIAFEMAQQLRRAGEEVLLVALMDTYGPQVSEGFDEIKMLLWQAWRFGVTLDPQDLADAAGFAARLDLVVDLARQRGAIPPTIERDRARRLLEVEIANLQAILDYRAEPYPGRLAYFQCAQGTDFGEFAKLFPRINEIDHAAGWRALTPHEMPVFELPGDHAALMDEPAVGLLARHLSICFAEVEGDRAALAVPSRTA